MINSAQVLFILKHLRPDITPCKNVHGDLPEHPWEGQW